jgi:ribonucleoside-diphosphate reductase alpha chain
MLRVLACTATRATRSTNDDVVPDDLLSAGQLAWDEAVRRAGARRAQQPGLGARAHRHHRSDDGLRHHRHRARPRPRQDEEAGRRRHDADRQPDDPAGAAPLGYDARQVDEIIAYIDENKSILGPPHLAAEHVPVFACSMGDNTIHYEGHVRMMGAVQPFLSGAISKTVNMPEEASVEDVERSTSSSWELGLKAVAIYRDNCKVAQPLSTAKKERCCRRAGAGAGAGAVEPVTVEHVVEKVVEKIVHKPIRQKLPRTRRSKTFEFRVADCKGFATIGEYENGSRARSSSRSRSRARPCPASWTPSPSRSATASSTACRCGRTSRRSRT